MVEVAFLFEPDVDVVDVIVEAVATCSCCTVRKARQDFIVPGVAVQADVAVIVVLVIPPVF
eukprot:2257627-Amphidinium_carterae.1